MSAFPRYLRTLLRTVPIKLRSSSGEEIAAVVECRDDGRSCELLLRFGTNETRSTASDYFEALARVRLQLELQGLIPVSYGASRQVFPSGMARDKGRGLKAYKLALGETASIDDIVEIFATGPDVQPTTVAEQRAFFEAWLDSQGSQRSS